MIRDYKHILPLVLQAMFPVRRERLTVAEMLSAYGKASYHREQDRVHLGILKLAWGEPEKLEDYIRLACEDYRDLLCAAEYPLSSLQSGLSENNPVKYKQLQENESAEYDAWLENVLSA
jgi:hypothetical protein